MFSNLSALELFIQERAVYVHEKANGMYRCVALVWLVGCEGGWTAWHGCGAVARS